MKTLEQYREQFAQALNKLSDNVMTDYEIWRSSYLNLRQKDVADEAGARFKAATGKMPQEWEDEVWGN